MMQLSVGEVGKAMLNTTIPGRGMRLVVATTVTLLLTLAALTAQASPAFAQDETLTVTKTGMGTVTSDPAGINCGDDCTETYPSSEDEICNTHGACTITTTYESVTLSASPAPGWALQSWGGACSGTGPCTITMNQNRSVPVTFVRVSPPNDDFAAAQLISGASTSVNGTTKDATREIETGEPQDHGDHTVWYKWTAPHTGEWTVDTCTATIDSILAVYTDGQLSTLNQNRVALNNNHNNACPGTWAWGSKLTFRAQKDQTYRIVVGDAGGARQNTFTLALNAIPAPANDNFENAQVISGASASVNGTNVSATRESDDDWSGTNIERSVWYRWTAPFSGSVALDTCTTNFDTLLGVSTGRSQGPFAHGNNECSSGFGSKLTFKAQRDQTYYISVDGCCGSPAGTFTLALDLVDDVAPETRIHSGPEDGSATSSTSVTFAFDADQADSTFKCRVYRSGLNAPAFGTCSGAGIHMEGGLDQGIYTFEVRATDTAGNSDATPAKRTFSVETTRPTVESWDPRGRKVRPSARPTVTFSEKMDEGSVEASANGKPTAFVLKKGATVIPATVSYTEDGTTFKATLTPARKLKAGAKYAAAVTAAATDEAGNALVAKAWTFTVKG